MTTPPLQYRFCPACGTPQPVEAATCGACGFDMPRAKESKPTLATFEITFDSEPTPRSQPAPEPEGEYKPADDLIQFLKQAGVSVPSEPALGAASSPVEAPKPAEGPAPALTPLSDEPMPVRHSTPPPRKSPQPDVPARPGRASGRNRFLAAGLSRRFVAFAADMLILAGMTGAWLRWGMDLAAIQAPVASISAPATEAERVQSFFFALAPWALGLFAFNGLWYSVLFGAALGRTPGKHLLGIRIVGRDGEKPAAWRCALRYAVSWISAAILGLGYVWAALDGRCQTLHDKIAGTFVVRRRLTGDTPA